MRTTDSSRMVWLVCGLLGGMLISYFWPHEAAIAEVDRDTDAKFAIVTVPTGLTGGDAVFVLDFLTGRLYGACLNPQLGKFNQFYIRNIIGDFGLTPDVKPKFVLTAGSLNISARGSRKQPAQSGLYIAELNSGRVLVYAFPFEVNPRENAPETLSIVDGFVFRQQTE